MTTGTIASLRDKGSGFIMVDGAAGRSDLFFHHNALLDTSSTNCVRGSR